jgi:hypothetical protein
LVVRKIPFAFEDVNFIWNPSNPEFSAFTNIVSFQAIGFERYICKAMREAEKLTKDPAMIEEIRAFNAQEMTHSLAHRKHVAPLIAKYPGLQGALDESIANFEELWKSAPLHYHLAYTANIEATFMPLFGTIIEHRDLLFAGGDPRVSSLMLWHFCEEIEHRSSAISVYNEVVGSSWYRITNLQRFQKHGAVLAAELTECFKKHVPGVPESYFRLKGFEAIPKPALRRMGFRILASQLPWYDHEHQELPAYYKEWYDRFERGEDMTNVFGERPSAQAA